jgi:hypothetical protein
MSSEHVWMAFSFFFMAIAVIQQVLVHHVLRVCQQAIDLMMEKS